MTTPTSALVPGVRTPKAKAGFERPIALLGARRERVKRSLALRQHLIRPLSLNGVDARARRGAFVR